jgi:hypothetical protein
MGIELWRRNPLGEWFAVCVVSYSYFPLFLSLAWLVPHGKFPGQIKKHSGMENHLSK